MSWGGTLCQAVVHLCRPAGAEWNVLLSFYSDTSLKSFINTSDFRGPRKKHWWVQTVIAPPLSIGYSWSIVRPLDLEDLTPTKIATFAKRKSLFPAATQVLAGQKREEKRTPAPWAHLCSRSTVVPKDAAGSQPLVMLLTWWHCRSLTPVPQDPPRSPQPHPCALCFSGCWLPSWAAHAASAVPYLGLLSAATAAGSQWVWAGDGAGWAQPHLLFAASPAQPSAGFRLQLPRALLKCSAPIFFCCDPLAKLSKANVPSVIRAF